MVDARGAVTVEAAIAIAALVVVVVVGLGAVLAASAQIRCVDAAREAARLAARGDESGAVRAAERVAPSGARVEVRAVDGDLIATVSVRLPVLLSIELAATAIAAAEPGAEP